ncbi:MAG: hypothetical protein ACK4RK_14525 [Gemmataceae bacterium]
MFVPQTAPATRNGVNRMPPLLPETHQNSKIMTAPPSPVPKRLSPCRETLFAGPTGEELPDYEIHYHPDGTIRETWVFFYGADQRAGQAHPGVPLRRKAIYRGQVDAYRLHAAHKLQDVYYVGAAGEEIEDYQVTYQDAGTVSETDVFFYEEDRRAFQSRPGQGLRRRATYVGHVQPYRLATAIKRLDTFFAGPPRAERRDFQYRYRDGEVTETVCFLYEGNQRAAAASLAPLRRQVTHRGKMTREES